jgi:hypothetical protein
MAGRTGRRAGDTARLVRWLGGAVLRLAGAVPAGAPSHGAHPGGFGTPPVRHYDRAARSSLDWDRGESRRVAGSAGPELRQSRKAMPSAARGAPRGEPPTAKRGRTPSHGVTGWRLAALHPLVREGKTPRKAPDAFAPRERGRMPPIRRLSRMRCSAAGAHVEIRDLNEIARPRDEQTELSAAKHHRRSWSCP